jgi:hypothetical protein
VRWIHEIKFDGYRVQQQRERDDDRRDVPEQRYARRAAQAVCRRELP